MDPISPTHRCGSRTSAGSRENEALIASLMRERDGITNKLDRIQAAKRLLERVLELAPTPEAYLKTINCIKNVVSSFSERDSDGRVPQEPTKKLLAAFRAIASTPGAEWELSGLFTGMIETMIVPQPGAAS